MDTDTVIEIMQIIDNQLYDININAINDDTEPKACITIGKRQALTELNEHLEKFITAQLVHLETLTGE
jgi:hypothetical protein